MASSKRWVSAGFKPVKRVELDEKHKKLRIVLLALAIFVAIVAFTVFLSTLLGQDSGWKRIETLADEVNCGQDFTLMYELGAGERSAAEENKLLSNLYSDATEKAYRLFSTAAATAAEGNLALVNASVNQIVTVDPALYKAFGQIVASGNRNLYLAPVYVEYDRVFLYENEDEAIRYDPARDPELAAYVQQLAAFANDPAMIDLELLENNQVRLNVAQAYVSFCQENELDVLIDFGWMKNAFIADMIADILLENGLTNGYIASYDGFSRNLDSRGEKFSFNLYDRYENSIYLPAVMEYDKPISIVFLRNYPMSVGDRWHYFAFSDGRILTAMIDPTDGMSKSATDNLVAYSYSESCAEVLLQTSKLYLSDLLDEQALAVLTEEGIFSIWFADTTLKYNNEDLALAMTQAEDIHYDYLLVK